LRTASTEAFMSVVSFDAAPTAPLIWPVRSMSV
jgi:hypothetical protein